LDPNAANAVAALSSTYAVLGQYEKAIEFIDKAMRLSPHDPALSFWYADKSWAYFELKQYDQAIESARRSIAINPNYASPYGILASALASTGHFSEARDAGQRYRDLRQHQGGAIHD
jgi:adenylate cyclase